MAYADTADAEELVVSRHDERRWLRRDLELAAWVRRAKPRRAAKRTALLGHVEVDAELLTALALLQAAGIRTEFSCAGVSLLDEPEQHSLYAYMTMHASPQAEAFVQFAMRRMRHRLLVTYEPARGRYDLSSFLIGHNRSYCLLIEACARCFIDHTN